ncbi:hypothetical protein ACFV0K_31185, partial [Streptomyces sp. NPDC059586]
MTGSAVPRPSQGQDDLLGKPPAHPATSEASRLLCAGVHLHDGYRDAVIDQLYVREQCFVAPSTGFDAARVLAHALRARRTELGWAGGILAAWLLGAVLTGGVIGVLFVPCILLALAPWIRGSAAEGAGGRGGGGGGGGARGRGGGGGAGGGGVGRCARRLSRCECP